jgi:hypothetical protein
MAVVPLEKARVVTYITDNPNGMPATPLTPLKDYNATSTAGDELDKKRAAENAANAAKAYALSPAGMRAALDKITADEKRIAAEKKARIESDPDVIAARALVAAAEAEVASTKTYTAGAKTSLELTKEMNAATTPKPSIYNDNMTPEQIADAAVAAAAKAEAAATAAAADTVTSGATAASIAASADAGAADAATAASTAATNAQEVADAAQEAADAAVAVAAAAAAVPGNTAAAVAAQEAADVAQADADAAQENADAAADEAEVAATDEAVDDGSAADAKAAAELKAKQEADAKAAAELKAKQEADAKAAADKAAKDAADKAAADKVTTQQRESIITILTDRFNKYGLGSLATKIRDLAIDGASEATITIGLQETEEYKVRFSANTDRLNKGLKVLSPAEYLNLEDGYRQILRSYGLKQFDTDAYVKQFIANDVSATELSDRVVTAVQRVQNADPAISKTLRDFYGIGSADMVAYVLDPNQQLQKIQRQVAAAEVGTAARRQGLEAGVQVSEQLAAQGVSEAEAQKGYSTIANILPTAEKLSQIYGGTMQKYGQTEGEQEVFNSLASAQRAREKLSAREIAQFQGTSGVNKTSLTSLTKGQL